MGDAAPLLRLWIGYYDAPDARETGQVIERLANAYTQTLPRVGGRPARLAVEQLRIGSLLVDLKAAFETGAAIVTIIEQREMLVGFVQRIALAVQAARDASMGIDISPSIRNFLYSFVKPVATGRASEARLHVEGDNNVVIVINGENAAALDSILQRLMPARGNGASGSYVGYTPVEPRFFRNGEGGGTLSLAQLDEAATAPGPEAQPTKLAQQPDIMAAKAMQIDGKWYAQPEGFNGVILPISGKMPTDMPASMQNDLALAGAVQFVNGRPVNFDVRSFVYVGDGQATTS